MSTKIKNIIFDLDDTLFDTMGLLVVPAIREACSAMIEKGLKCSIEECIELRWEMRRSGSRASFFETIAEKFAPTHPETKLIASAGEKAFLKRQIKESIKLFPETINTLKELKNHYRLFLITIGDPQTQAEKVKLLELKDFFEKIYYVDGDKEKTKKSAFNELLEMVGDLPQEFLSVGNRIDSDVKFAKELGMKGVLFEHGEYLHLVPEHRFERPDHKIKNLKELSAWLKQ